MPASVPIPSPPLVAGFDVTQVEPKDTLGLDEECELHMHCIRPPPTAAS